MFAKIPHGRGHAMLDAAYDANENCHVICKSCRKPAIRRRGNCVIKGSGPRAEMLRRQKEHPEEFAKICPDAAWRKPHSLHSMGGSQDCAQNAFSSRCRRCCAASAIVYCINSHAGTHARRLAESMQFGAIWAPYASHCAVHRTRSHQVAPICPAFAQPKLVKCP